MNEAPVRKLCIMFNDERTNIHDEERSGKPSVVTVELKSRTEKKINTIDVLVLSFRTELVLS